MRFIRKYGRITKRLTNLTKKDVPFNFDLECLKSFEDLKIALTSAPLLSLYDSRRQSCQETDASDGIFAAVFSQKDDRANWHLVAFFSKTMQSAELNYQVHDKEMLAIVQSLSNWKAKLLGSPNKLGIVTDHRALKYFRTSKTHMARQAR